MTDRDLWILVFEIVMNAGEHAGKSPYGRALLAMEAADKAVKDCPKQEVQS